MSEKLIKVRVPESKVRALEFFLTQKETTIEAELTKAVDTIYERFVPKEVRSYVDRTKSTGKEKPQGRP